VVGEIVVAGYFEAIPGLKDVHLEGIWVLLPRVIVYAVVSERC
jgi:hypothetical protein